MAAKKHKLKKAEPLPHIEGSFDIVGCDLSMYCPAFALFHYNANTRKISLKQKDYCSNRSNGDKKKPHGKILGEIASMLGEFLKGKDVQVAVRERAFSKFAQDTITLNKVCGVTDMTLWFILHRPFEEVTATQVKKYVTGNGKATKEDVAEAIGNYCEHTVFQVDDESDACGVAISWLIMNGYMETIPLEKYKDMVTVNGQSA